MTYDKEVSFPYPILSFLTKDYKDNNFRLSLSPLENNDYFEFSIDYNLPSEFINSLIVQKIARIYLLIDTKDAKFYEVNMFDKTVKIPRSRITLNSRSYFQLAVVSNSVITFDNNDDLDEIYNEYRKKIQIQKNQILALSNLERFDGEIKKPFELFKSQVEPTLKTAIKIDIENEFIVIKLRDDSLKYNSFLRRKELNYHYVYMGLQKALMEYLRIENKDIIILDEIEEPTDPLFRKLNRFLKVKRIKKYGSDDIDDVIHAISDRIIEKHYQVIKELNDREN